MMTDNEKRAAEKAASLHALADFVQANPQFAEDIHIPYLLAMPHMREIADQRAWLVEWKDAALQAGLSFAKEIDGDDFEGHVDFGAFKVRVLADRGQVCERVVTGTETVTKKVKDPAKLAEVPEIEVTEEVETVDWICRPLLAGGES